MRYLMTFSYDGNIFYGYQKQVDKRTVQGELEKILTIVNNKKPVSVQSSGRTDKGVHAICQKAHFDLKVNAKTYSLKKLLNKYFTGDIYVKDVEIVPDDFHARYNVKSKTYSYYINTLEFDIFKRNYIYQYCDKLDTQNMKEALKYLTGEHDFRSFCKEEKEKENCVRTIYKASITSKKGVIKITFTGNGFLRKMVRNIVGVLIEIGSGRKTPSYMNEVINSNGELHNMKSVPGCGLYLENVKY